MKLKPLLIVILTTTFANVGVYSQCVLTGLSSTYCASDMPDTLSATCSGQAADIFGPGVNNQGVFNPGVAGPGTHVVTVVGDPDAYNVSTAGIFDTIAGSGTQVFLGDDAVSSNLQIGFSFRFFDNAYSTFNISSNGFILFGGSDNGCCSGQALPDATDPDNLIAFAWEDLDPDGSGVIEYFTTGISPNRRCVINFRDVPHFPGPGPTNNVTAQIQLWEGCGQIEIHTTTQPDATQIHTMGIENSAGTVAFTAPGRNASAWTATNDYVAFIPGECITDTVVVSGGPAVDVTNDTVDCASDTDGALSVTATGVSPYTYLWSTSATATSISGLAPGTYTCTVTDAVGCANEGEGEVIAPLPLGVIFDNTNTVCESGMDGEIVSNSSGGVPPYSYTWDDPSNSTTANVSSLAVGTYNVTLTDDNGCTFVSVTTIGFDNTDPVVDLGDDKSFCPGQSAVLVGPPLLDSYTWSNGDTLLSTIVNTSGPYSLTVTDAAGCTGADDILISVYTPVQVDLGPNLSGPPPISIDAGVDFTNYLWNTGFNGQTISVTLSGQYSVIVTDSNGCKTNDSVQVGIWPNGINELGEASLSLYPNPTSDRVYVKASEPINNARITLFDLSGREVNSFNANLKAGVELPIDLNGLDSGTYFVRIQANGEVTDMKLTIQK